MSARIITFANHKGGSAKTTSVTTIGHGVTKILQATNTDKKKVLVVDTDSQAHSTLLLTGYKEYPEYATLAGIIHAQANGMDVKSGLDQAIVSSTWDDNLHILPASATLDTVEEATIGRDGNVYYLKRILRYVKDDYAAIIIDTCPKFSLLTKMALLASDEVIIPVAPLYLDTDGLVSMVNNIEDIRNNWESEKPDVTGVVIVKFSTKIRGHSEVRDSVAADQKLGKLYLGTVPLNADIEYAQGNKQSIFDFNPKSKSAAAYGKITRIIAERLVVRAR